MLQDLCFAVRRLASRPAFTGLMVLTLALGIGANTAVFSVVDQTVLRPAPFANADRLVDVMGRTGNNLTPEKIRQWQAESAVFERLEGYTPRTWDLTGEGEPERIRGFVVTTGLFPMLGVQPDVGRTFVAGENGGADGSVAIVSDRFARRRFGRSVDAIGRHVTLNDQPHTVVGVMPGRFRLMGDWETVYVPVDVTRPAGESGAGGFYGLGRLPAGLSREVALERTTTLADGLQKANPIPESWVLRLEQKLVARVNPTTRRALLVLLGGVGFVLLIVCSNVAHWAIDRNQPIEAVALVADLHGETFQRERFVLLMMSVFATIALVLAAAGIFAVLSQLVTERTREIGIRVALGATPDDIFRMIVSRGLGLAAVGVVLGIGGATALSRLLDTLLFEVSPYDAVSYASVALGLTAVAFIACWLPTRRGMRIQPAEALRVE